LPTQRVEVPPGTEQLAVVSNNLNARTQMGRQRIGRPGRGRNRDAESLVDEPGEVIQERAPAGVKVAYDFSDLRRQRHQLAPDGTRQGPEQLADLFLAQSRHRPGDAGRRDGLNQPDRKPYRHAIPVFAGRVSVTQRHGLLIERDLVRERLRVVAEIGVTNKVSFTGAEKIRIR